MLPTEGAGLWLQELINKKLKEKLRRQQIGSGGMFAALGKGWQGCGPKWPAWLTPKWQTLSLVAQLPLKGCHQQMDF